ncbi:hypothetical protein [Castellaniella sp.]|uniref:phosphatase domain-containing protein n=1 Tax=Castellaniella sp. TaxID=1955812 RepID=UPI002B0025C3|nr:hypothetical protein [Castellaniella sp.]
MKPLYIFDLDGTLADLSHRKHFIGCSRGEQKWDSFYAHCHADEPIWPVIDTLNALKSSGADVWIFSGRSDWVREETRYWLELNTALTGRELETCLMMRRDGDYTPDDKLKESWLNNMLEVDRQRLVAVFDDRDRVVAMWRANGVRCFQVAPGSF